MAADDKAFLNYRTNIYFKALDEIFFSNTTVGSDTESEAVYLPESRAFLRMSYLGFTKDDRQTKSTTSKDSMPYFIFLEYLLYN